MRRIIRKWLGVGECRCQSVDDRVRRLETLQVMTDRTLLDFESIESEGVTLGQKLRRVRNLRLSQCQQGRR